MALPINTVWEARITGSDTNGGGYIPGSSGTDWSQQDNPQYNVTNAVANGTTTVTSATANFGTDTPGNLAYIGGQWYQIVSRTNTTTIVVDRTIATASGLTLKIGGALATPLPAYSANAPYAAGALVTIWFRAATWNLTTGWTVNITSSGTVTIMHLGYGTTRGDSGAQPLITSATTSLDLISCNEGASAVIFRNMKFTHTGSTRGIGIRAVNSGANLRVEGCNFDGLLWGINGDNVGSRYPWVNVVVADTEIKNCVTGGLLTNGGNLVLIHSWVHNNTGYGIASNNSVNLTVERSIISSNGLYGAGNAGGNGFVYPLLYNSVFYTNGGNGLTFTPQNGGYVGLYARNCCFYGNSAYGLSASAAGLASYMLDHCAYGANTSGNLQNLGSGTGDVTPTTDPFVSATNFALNSAAGGGALLKAAGFPGAFPGGGGTGSLDIGAVQSGAGGSPGAGGSFTFLG